MRAIEQFRSSHGHTIYCLPTRSFEGMVTNLYLIDDGQQLTLVDCGAGVAEGNQDLLDGLEALNETFSQKIRLADLDRILITHGHLDHFGGLPFVRRFSDAPAGIHLLDRRILVRYEESVTVAAGRLNLFLESAGVSADPRAHLIAMFRFTRQFYQSTPAQFLLSEAESLPGAIDVIHVPGHCAGQVCLRLGDILLTADHVLAQTTPHQSPESINGHAGLARYLDSLAKIERLDGVRLALGGHEEPITDLRGRIQAIKKTHHQRLEYILEFCRQPRSIKEISRYLFGPVSGYHILLALTEAGAHAEYLYQRGELKVVNLDEIEQTPNPVICYQRA